MIRTSLINGVINLDSDFSKYIESLSNPGVIEGFNVQDGVVKPGKARVKAERTNGETIYCYVENTEDVSLSGNDGKVYIVIDQEDIDSGLVSEDGSNIARIEEGDVRPEKNFLKLYDINGVDIEDKRFIIKTIQNITEEIEGDINGLDTRVTKNEEDIAELEILKNQGSIAMEGVVCEDVKKGDVLCEYNYGDFDGTFVNVGNSESNKFVSIPCYIQEPKYLTNLNVILGKNGTPTLPIDIKVVKDNNGPYGEEILRRVIPVSEVPDKMEVNLHNTTASLIGSNGTNLNDSFSYARKITFNKNCVLTTIRFTNNGNTCIIFDEDGKVIKQQTIINNICSPNIFVHTGEVLYISTCYNIPYYSSGRRNTYDKRYSTQTEIDNEYFTMGNTYKVNNQMFGAFVYGSSSVGGGSSTLYGYRIRPTKDLYVVACGGYDGINVGDILESGVEYSRTWRYASVDGGPTASYAPDESYLTEYELIKEGGERPNVYPGRTSYMMVLFADGQGVIGDYVENKNFEIEEIVCSDAVYYDSNFRVQLGIGDGTGTYIVDGQDYYLLGCCTKKNQINENNTPLGYIHLYTGKENELNEQKNLIALSCNEGILNCLYGKASIEDKKTKKSPFVLAQNDTQKGAHFFGLLSGPLQGVVSEYGDYRLGNNGGVTLQGTGPGIGKCFDGDLFYIIPNFEPNNTYSSERTSERNIYNDTRILNLQPDKNTMYRIYFNLKRRDGGTTYGQLKVWKGPTSTSSGSRPKTLIYQTDSYFYKPFVLEFYVKQGECVELDGWRIVLQNYYIETFDE